MLNETLTWPGSSVLPAMFTSNFLWNLGFKKYVQFFNDSTAYKAVRNI